MTILILEDDPQLGPVLFRRILAKGHNAILMTSIAQAETHFNDSTTNWPTAFIVDRQLPDGDGWRFAKRWLSHLPHVVFMSGNPEPRVTHPYWHKGVDDMSRLFELLEP